MSRPECHIYCGCCSIAAWKIAHNTNQQKHVVFIGFCYQQLYSCGFWIRVIFTIFFKNKAYVNLHITDYVYAKWLLWLIKLFTIYNMRMLYIPCLENLPYKWSKIEPKIRKVSYVYWKKDEPTNTLSFKITHVLVMTSDVYMKRFPNNKLIKPATPYASNKVLVASGRDPFGPLTRWHAQSHMRYRCQHNMLLLEKP